MLLQPRRRVAQPQGPVEIDWANPLTRGLVLLDLRPGIGQSVDFGRADYTMGFGSVENVAGANGRGLRVMAEGNHYLSYGLVGQLSPPYSVLFQYVMTEAPSTTLRVFGNFSAGIYGYTFGPSATNGRFLLARSGANTVLTGGVHRLGVVRTVVGVVTATAASYFEDGVLVAGPVAHGGVATPSGALRIGADNTGATAGAARVTAFAVALFGRALGAAEARALSESRSSVWQLARPLPARYTAAVVSGPVQFYRPAGDLIATGWTSTAATLAGAINEPTPADASYITSPDASSATPARLSLPSMPAGSYTLRLRARRTASAGELRVVLLDAANAPVGAGVWQALTGTYATYSLAVATTGTATRFEIEVRT